MALHWSNTAMLIMIGINRGSTYSKITHSEESPLQHLTVVVRVVYGIKRQLEVFVVMESQVEYYRGSLEDGKVVARTIDQGGDSSIWINFEEPRILDVW